MQKAPPAFHDRLVGWRSTIWVTLLVLAAGACGGETESAGTGGVSGGSRGDGGTLECSEGLRYRPLLGARSLRVSGTNRGMHIGSEACERTVRAGRTAGSLRLCRRRQCVHAGNLRGWRLPAPAGLRRQRMPQRRVSRRPMLHGLLGRHELSGRNGDQRVRQQWLRLPDVQRHRRAVLAAYVPGVLQF